MNEREALKLALEALELEDMACRYEKDQTPEHITKAIIAIKEALAQPEQNQFNPDWDAMAVMVEEQQRMAKRIAELEAQRKPLTDEDLETMAEKYVTNCYFDTLKYARAIEAAHGIKE